ncbi:MAG TPA: prolipoprotein diacylglyceryl transferase family protein [Chloroflexota bacterium]|nr:prolipoprotein diacylglyceryl transferase family protein [Chloroflexota bacterium]
MLIALDPIVLSIGPLTVRWFGLLTLVGLGLAAALSLAALRREGFSATPGLAALAWAWPAGIVTARLVEVLGWWDYYLAHAAEVWQLSVDRLSLWGGLVGGALLLGARVHSRRQPGRHLRVLDTVVPYVALAVAIAQLGAFLDGHGQGRPTDLPWATWYASPLAATPDFGVPRHPAQAYEALVALGLYLGLTRLPRSWPAGSRVATFILLFGGARLILGAVRLEPAFLFGLQIEQLIASAAMLYVVLRGLGAMVSSRRRTSRPTTTSGQPRPTEETLAA